MKKLFKISLLLVGILLLCTPVVVLAQAATTPEVSPENPLPTNPFDLLGAVDYMIKSFQQFWYLGIAVALFLLVNLIRGKLKIGKWPVRIPKLSDWFDGAGAKVKFWLIVGLTGVGMGFAGLGTIVGDWAVFAVLKAFVGGLVTGVTLALASMGVKTGWKLHRPKPKEPPA